MKIELNHTRYSFFIKSILVATLIFLVYVQIGIGITKYATMLFDQHSTQLVLKPFLINCAFSVAFMLLYLSRNRGIRWLSYLFTFLTFATFISYAKLQVSGPGFATWIGFDVSDANTILMESGRPGATGAALSAFGPVIYLSMFMALLYTTLIWLVIKLGGISKLSTPITLIPIVALCLCYGMWNNSWAGVNYFPVVVKVPFQFYAASHLPVYRGQRDPVTLSVDKSKQFDKVIYLIEESIRGDKLSINGFDINTTPYLQKIHNCIFNYGIATSTSNTSAPSNIMLQTGIRRDEMKDNGTAFFKKTNIFQYAKSAGYKTIYIDGQTKGSKLQNYMRGTDFDFIDQAIQIRSKYPTINRYEIDMKIAQDITSIFKQYPKEKIFIYVVKAGSHFVYKDSIPGVDPELAKSIIQQDKNTDASIRQLRLEYYSSMKWNIDHFFETLIPNIANYNPLILYTSDHGECLREDGSYITHGVVNGPIYQGIVPLTVFALGNTFQKYSALAQKNYFNNYNKSSDFNLFSTLLVLFGYSTQDIAKNYEPSLFDKLGGNRTYYTGISAGNVNYLPVVVHDSVPKAPPISSYPTCNMQTLLESKTTATAQTN